MGRWGDGDEKQENLEVGDRESERERRGRRGKSSCLRESDLNSYPK